MSIRYLDTDKMQYELAEWVEKNFGKRPNWQPLLGVQEEVGELSHAFLKRAQGIRQNENHDEAIMDAIGDIFIYLLDFCNSENLSIYACIQMAWDEVMKRDWAIERMRDKNAEMS